MLQKNLEKLEFSKIKKILSDFAITDNGKDFALNLTPATCLDEAKKLLDETTESYILLFRKGSPPLEHITDISIPLKTLENGGFLSATSLLNITNILKESRLLKEYFHSDIDTSFCLHLSDLFNNLYSNPKIEEIIYSSILDENTIADNASLKLSKLRKESRQLEINIRQKLLDCLHSSYIQEPIITIRSGRFVIPVKQECRSEVKGFVHDISSSGSTIFVEPITVFELNNRLNEIKLEENIEIEKILQNLSSLFYGLISELNKNVNIIGKIDFSFAKAKYAVSIDATEPILESKKIISLQKARHPLIPANVVVPISIKLGIDFSCLIITGPNTGGKTVALKTVGLLCVMASSGLYIPAAEKSSVYVFDKVFADIGDEQSIQESLSTFSSHITNIVEILHNATASSLVLLDELGSRNRSL